MGFYFYIKKLALSDSISPGKISHKNAKNSCQRVHNFMIIVFNQRMIQAYMEELMIKLATLLKNTMGYGV